MTSRLNAGDPGAPLLVRNPVSLGGIWITTLASLAFGIYLVLAWFGWLASPYSGLFGFVVVPLIFAAGLSTILAGVWHEARRRRRNQAAWAWPVVDFTRPRTRTLAGAIGVLTIVNLGVISIASVGAVRYTESDRFCGEVCHVPMRPEFTAHHMAPHANVSCVTCHIAPGAGGQISAKLNGTRQLYLVLTGRFARPIPEPIGRIPMAAETCSRCHTPGYPARDVTRTIREYADDAASTETVTSLVVHVGSIHWHARSDVAIDYVATDQTHQTIPDVRVTDATGAVTEYVADGALAPRAGAWHRMDCLDCHNRPAHALSSSVEQSVDGAIAGGAVNRNLPFVRREMVAALQTGQVSDAVAVAEIRTHLANAYRAVDATLAPEVARATATAEALYGGNVFPDMRVTWGTYASALGHIDAPGCFRCHDGAHKAPDGRVIGQDCELCHTMP